MKLIVNFIFISAAGVFFVWLGLSLADSVTKNNKATIVPTAVIATSVPTPIISPTAVPKIEFKLLKKIQEGLALLKKSAPLKYETQKNHPDTLVRKQIALAILNKNTGGVFEKRVWVNEADINNFAVTGIVSVSPDQADEYLNIQPKQWNSFNSYFEIIDHPEMIVVANKYLLLSSSVNSLPERSSGKYTDILYAPYSPALATNEIISAGKDYLNKIVNEAFTDINNKIETLAIERSFIKDLILIEHIDPDSYSVSSDNGQELANRMLTIIGANQSHAYRYTGSPAGANGLAQFIKPTYDNILSKYPTAGLNANYYLGMADHVNAIEAMILFFDYYKSDIEQKITQPVAITDEMLVASYNGGTTPIIKSINKYGSNWFSSQINLPEDQQILRPETINYLQKFKSISTLNIF